MKTINQPEKNGSRFFTSRLLHRIKHAQLGYVFTYADKAALSRTAQVHALDLRSDLSDDMQITAQLLASEVRNNGISTQGQGAWIGLSHQLSDTWQHDLEMTYYDDKLLVNDVGYLKRNDLISFAYNNEKIWNDFSQSDALLKRKVAANIESKQNTENQHLGSIFKLSGTETYQNTASLNWNLKYFSQAKDDRVSRGNGTVSLDQGFSSFFEYNWGNLGRFRQHSAFVLFDRDDQGKGIDFHYHPSFYFTDNYRLSWSLWMTKSEDKLLWHNNNLNRYSYESINNGIDFDATVADNQEIRVRFEWVSYKGYDGVNANLYAFDEFKNTDYKVVDFGRTTTRFQIRYRYEIAPLSNIYLVYSRGGSAVDSGEQSPWQTLDQGWSNRNADNFVAKIRYRF